MQANRPSENTTLSYGIADGPCSQQLAVLKSGRICQRGGTMARILPLEMVRITEAAALAAASLR